MAKQHNCEKYAYLDQLSTQRLEAFVRADVEAPGDSNAEVIFHILEVLKEREREHPTGCLADVNEAWAEFQQYYNIPEGEGLSLYPVEVEDEDDTVEAAPTSKVRSVRSALKIVGVAAAVVVGTIGLMIGAQAAGIDLFGAIGRWTDETFHFSTAPPASNSVPSKERVCVNLLRNALKECGIPEQIAPTRFPEGFEMSEPEILNLQLYSSVLCSFADCEDRLFALQIERFHSVDDVTFATFEKDDSNVAVYTKGAKTFYIFSNLDGRMATWSENTLVFTISGDISDDEIKLIIDSIGE